jgi:hypothetical protein
VHSPVLEVPSNAPKSLDIPNQLDTTTVVPHLRDHSCERPAYLYDHICRSQCKCTYDPYQVPFCQRLPLLKDHLSDVPGGLSKEVLYRLLAKNNIISHPVAHIHTVQLNNAIYQIYSPRTMLIKMPLPTHYYTYT